MSRLESFIRRLEAQRALLDLAAAAIAGKPGHILELGLGNGRSYDHLRERCPGRLIYVFDRAVAAHPDCVPPSEFLRLGDFSNTVPAARRQLGDGAAILIHADLGSGMDALSRALARSLLPDLIGLLAPGGYLLGDQDMSDPALETLPLPAAIRPDRYFIARRR